MPQSFFERLTGSISLPEEIDIEVNTGAGKGENWMSDTPEEGELSVDVFQNPNEIIIKTMVAGVKPEDLDVSITRDCVTIHGERSEERTVSGDEYITRELYWGSFSRTINLPEEINVDEAEAVERHGMLILRLPKLDKNRQTKLRVKGN